MPHAEPLCRLMLDYWGYIGVMENRMETTIVYWGYIRIMENKMETTIVYWGYIGIMEKKMETTILPAFAVGLPLGISVFEWALQLEAVVV